MRRHRPGWQQWCRFCRKPEILKLIWHFMVPRRNLRWPENEPDQSVAAQLAPGAQRRAKSSAYIRQDVAKRCQCAHPKRQHLVGERARAALSETGHIHNWAAGILSAR